MPRENHVSKRMRHKWSGCSALVLMVAMSIGATSAQEAGTVFLDGRSMRVQVVAPNQPADGPVVVFESGAGTGLATWSTVLPEVGRFARAVAYDRAGIGLSETDGQLPTPRHVAKKLHRLLAELHLPPPYVLVGHSWGGPLIRMFAALFPQDVAGMVYVDPTHLRTREQEVEYLLASGYTRDGALQNIKRHRERLARYISSRTGPYRAEMEVIQRNEESFFAEFRSLPAVREIPVAVLVSGRFDPAMWMERPCEPKACHAHWLRYRTEWLEALAPKPGRETVTIVAHSGHEIQREAPAVVVASIRRVLSASTQK